MSRYSPLIVALVLAFVLFAEALVFIITDHFFAAIVFMIGYGISVYLVCDEFIRLRNRPKMRSSIFTDLDK